VTLTLRLPIHPRARLHPSGSVSWSAGGVEARSALAAASRHQLSQSRCSTTYVAPATAGTATISAKLRRRLRAHNELRSVVAHGQSPSTPPDLHDRLAEPGIRDDGNQITS